MAGPWRNSAFRNLWIAQTFSQFGASITVVALPLAAFGLHGSAMEVGLLSAAGTLPYLVVSPFAGVWLDRHSKRLLLVLADLVRSGLLLVIPLCAVFGILSVPLLIAIALLVGAATVVSDVGYTACLPTLVRTEELVHSNSMIELSSSGSLILGNSVGGMAVQLFTAPLTILANTATALLSAFFTRGIPPERAGVRVSRQEGAIWREVRLGIAFILGNRSLRALTGASGTFNLFLFLSEPAFLVYVVRSQGLTPFQIGVVFSASGAGTLAGALVATRAIERLGVSAALTGSLAIAGATSAIVPAAGAAPHALIPALTAVAHFLMSAMVIVFNITQRSVRTALTPEALYGRMNASIRMIVMGVAPLGSVLGGWLTTAVGPRAALVAGAIGMATAFLWLRPFRLDPSCLALTGAGTNRRPRPYSKP
ncbi:MFS transporter [Streptomyces longwoodensis]|uniref:MFS transporter n=1 Tax=Streptomyces longwoodensis TaxID=68231 RepID=UPI0033D8711C